MKGAVRLEESGSRLGRADCFPHSVPKSIRHPSGFHAAGNRRRGHRRWRWIGRESRGCRCGHPVLRSRGTARCPWIKSQWPGGTIVMRRWSDNVHVAMRGKIFPAALSRNNSASMVFPSRAANSLAAARKLAGDCSICSASQCQSRPSMISAGTTLLNASIAHAARARVRR